MVDSDAEELRQAVRDMSRAQAEFYGVVYVELSAIKENTARMSERVEGVSSRIDGLVAEGAQMSAVIRVLEAAEDRRIERARLTVVAGKFLAWAVGIVATVFSVATAIAHLGSP